MGGKITDVVVTGGGTGSATTAPRQGGKKSQG